MRLLPVSPRLAWPLAFLLAAALLGVVAFLIAPPVTTAQDQEPPPPPGAQPPVPPVPDDAVVTGTQGLPAPPRPIFNSVTATTSTSVTVTFWPQKGIRIYTVSYRRSGIPANFRNKSTGVDNPSGLTTVVVTGLQCGLEYEFWGWAYGDGMKTASAFNDPPAAGPHRVTPACDPTATPTPTPVPPPPVLSPPPAPTGLTATATGPTTVDLTWSSRSGVTRYWVQQRIGTSGTWRTTSSNITGVSYAVTGLTANTTYQFQARAYGNGTTYAARWGAWSQPDSATTPPELTAPPAPTDLKATATGPTTIDLTWKSPSGITRHEVQRREGAAGPWVTVSATIQGASHTVTGLTPNTSYSFAVRAYGDGTTYAAQWGAWTTASPPITTDLPTITIERFTPPDITEGADAVFFLFANAKPTTDIVVNISITQTGSFLIVGPPLPFVKITPEGEGTQLTLQTIDDTMNEADGAVTVTVGRGAGYIVGDLSFASVIVKDNDPPSAPTGLGANGNISNGAISLWWQPVPLATAYDVRYARETCPSGANPVVCAPGAWREIHNITMPHRTLTAGTVGAQLAANTDPDTDTPKGSAIVYRLQVRATQDTVRSDWSAPAFVNPRNRAPTMAQTDDSLEFSRLPHIATAPLYGYQSTNLQGRHVFRYRVCDGTIPDGVNLNAAKMAAAVDTWEVAVRKNSTASMVLTTRLTSGGDVCQPPRAQPGAFPPGHNAVLFADDDAMSMAGCYEPVAACWRSQSLEYVLLDQRSGGTVPLRPIVRGTILLRDSGDASVWNAQAHENACTIAEHTIAHEAGHALGIGRVLYNYHIEHPRNAMLSIMNTATTLTPRYCTPQAYDILAVMANYQSR